MQDGAVVQENGHVGTVNEAALQKTSFLPP
jgi:hypothetical protein